MTDSIVMNVRAYCKMILHAVKYPHCTVNGLLLASRPSKGGAHLQIQDAIPLFHLGAGLAPMTEVAFSQVDQYCKEVGLHIAGYYQANMAYKDASPDYFATKLAEKIYENFGDACLIMVNNRKLSLECEEPTIQLYHFSDGKWKQKEKVSVRLIEEDKTLAALSSLLLAKKYRCLQDFDTYLESGLSWENLSLNKEIDQYL